MVPTYVQNSLNEGYSVNPLINIEHPNARVNLMHPSVSASSEGAGKR